MDAPIRSHNRIVTLFAAFNALVAAKMLPGEAFHKSGLSGYTSRGHGKAKPFQQSFASNANRQSRSKYMPHVGLKEIERHSWNANLTGVYIV